MGSNFETTRWTLVLAAGGRVTPHSREALAALCEAYWQPIYAFVRSRGYDSDRAADLTQAFFTDLLEKGYLVKADPAHGKFRSFLLASVKHVLSHERAREQALKRGGSQASISLDRQIAEDQYVYRGAAGLTPETVFEKQWAMTVLRRAMDRVREDFERDGKLRHFECLQPLVGGNEPSRPYREVAEQLGTTEAAVKMAVRRLRKHFARTLRAEIAETVGSPDEVKAEIQYLRSVLAS